MIYATSLLARSAVSTAHVQAAQQRVIEAQYDIASGTSITTGSDDPVAAQRSLRMRAALERISTWQSNMDLAEGRQDAMDNALQEYDELLASAMTIANQGASSATMNDETRAALAAEVTALIGRLQAIVNTESGGNYLFGGTASDAPPYTFDGDEVTYHGTATSQTVAITATQTTLMNLPGCAVFQQPADAFDTLTGLRDALLGGDDAAISAALTGLGEVSANLYTVQTRVGAATESLSAVRSILDGISATSTADLSRMSDTDMAEASVRLSAADVAYQAALEIAAKLDDSTILDFI